MIRVSPREFEHIFSGNLVELKLDQVEYDLVVNSDTRSIASGEIFIAIRGANFDGNAYASESLKKGASFAVVSDKSVCSNLNQFVLVQNTTLAYQQLANFHRNQFRDLKIGCVSGSVGKTTVKEMVQEILNLAGPNVVTEKNFNNDVGVALTLFRVTQKTKYAFIECGARHINDLDPLIDCINPTSSGLLNIGRSHLGIFKTFENLKKTKLAMLKNPSPDTILIYNLDDPSIKEYVSKNEIKNGFSYGTSMDARIRIVESILKPNGHHCLIEFDQKQLRVEIPSIHLSTPINGAAAVAFCLSMGVSEKHIIDGLKNFKDKPGRFFGFSSSHHKSCFVIDDSYNASPTSMKQGILSALNIKEGSLVLILGDMLELGEDESSAHADIVDFVSKLPDIESIFIGPRFGKEIKDNSTHFDTVDNFLDVFGQTDFSHRTVYIKGSNGIGLKRLVEKF